MGMSNASTFGGESNGSLKLQFAPLMEKGKVTAWLLSQTDPPPFSLAFQFGKEKEAREGCSPHLALSLANQRPEPFVIIRFLCVYVFRMEWLRLFLSLWGHLNDSCRSQWQKIH